MLARKTTEILFSINRMYVTLIVLQIFLGKTRYLYFKIKCLNFEK